MPLNNRQLHAAAASMYLAIIALGVWSEVFARGSLIVGGDAEATAAAVVAREGLLRASFAADVGMALCDVGVGVALFALLQEAGWVTALAATAFRFVQATLIGTSLLGMQAALRFLDGSLPPEVAEPLAALALDIHGLGYDLGLVFFAVNCALTGLLVVRSTRFPGWLGWALGASGAVYLLGSGAALLAPELSALVEPLYVIPLVAETAFCIALFRGALRRRDHPARSRSSMK